MIGERLKGRLTEMGMSQSELARRLSLNQSTIAGLISGKARSSSYLHLIARELRTTPAYLTGEVDDPNVDAPPPRQLSPEQQELLAVFDSLTPFDRETVMRAARALGGIGMPSKQVHASKREYKGEKIAS